MESRWRKLAPAPGNAALRRTGLVYTIFLSLLVLSASQLSGLVFSSDLESFVSTGSQSGGFEGETRSTIDIIVGPGAVGAVDLGRLADLQRQLLPAHFINNVLSVFSMRLPVADGSWEAVLPLHGDEAGGLDALDPVAKSFLAPFWNGANGEFRFIVAVTSRTTADHLVALERVRAAAQPLIDEGYRVAIGGKSPVQAVLPQAIQRDQATVTLSGLVFGFVIAAFLLRSALVAALMVVPSVFAVLAILGTLAVTGIPVSMLTSSALTLVLIIGIADAIHLYSAWKKALPGAADQKAAMRQALAETAPAIALTTGTTAICFVAVAVASPPGLAHLGLVGGIGCVALFFAVTTLWPVILVTLVGPRRGRSPSLPAGMELLPKCFRVSWGSGLVAVAFACLVGLIAAQTATQTRLVISDALPDRTEGVLSATEIDAGFGGSTPIRISIHLAEGNGILTDAGWSAFADAAERLSATGIGVVVSHSQAIAELDDDARRAALEAAARPPIYSMLPEFEPWMLLMVRDDANLIDVKAALDSLAGDLALDHPVTGIEMTRRVAELVSGAERTIFHLSRNALLAATIALLLLAAAYRSWRVPLVLAVPNLLPILAVATAASTLGDGVSIEIAVALTIAFGIALDDSIHVLEHIHRHGKDYPARDTISPALSAVGPVLIVTTMILVAGTSTMLLSDFEVIRRSGVATLSALIVALICDLFVLPAAARLLWRKG